MIDRRHSHRRGIFSWRTAETGVAALIQALPWLLFISAVGIGAWRTAGWVWRLSPHPEAPARFVELRNQPALSTNRHWFGASVTPAKTETAETPISVKSTSTITDLQLLGVIAGGPEPAALFKKGKDTFEITVGEEFANDLTLKSIGPGAVILLRDGQEETLTMKTLEAVDALQRSAIQRHPRTRSNK